jgi:predicted nucleic acid-binding protein
MLVLVDTSIWVGHLTKGSAPLRELLERGEVLCHPLVIGALACGNIANRTEILALLRELPQARVAEHDEVLDFIEARQLAGRGLGLIDVHLLAASVLSRVPLWTADKQLHGAATTLGVAYTNMRRSGDTYATS